MAEEETQTLLERLNGREVMLAWLVRVIFAVLIMIIFAKMNSLESANAVRDARMTDIRINSQNVREEVTLWFTHTAVENRRLEDRVLFMERGKE